MNSPWREAVEVPAPRAARRWPEAVVFALLALLVLLSPLLFGLVEAHRRPVVGLMAGCIVAVVSLRGRVPPPGRLLRVGALAGLVIALVSFLQLVPLPPGLLSILSPQRAAPLERLRPEASAIGMFTSTLPAGAWLAGKTPEALSAHPEATRRAALLLVSLLVIFVAAALVARDPGLARSLALCVLAIATFEAVYGLVEYLSGHQHIFGYRKRHYVHAVTGTYINKNHLAGLMELALPLAVGMYWERLPSLRRPRSARAWLLSLSEARRGEAGLLLLAIGLMAAAVLLSFSRSGIALSAGALGGLLAWLRMGQRGASPRVLRPAALVLLVLSPLAWIHRAEIARSFTGLPSDIEEPGGRLDVWKATAALIGDFPVLGAGLGTFQDVFPRYATAPIRLRFRHTHNGYLELASGVGLPAAIMGAAAVAWLLAGCLRASATAGRRAGLAAGAAMGCAALMLHELVDFNLAIPANALLFGVCLGIAVGSSGKPARVSPARRASLPAWARVLGVAIACAMVAESVTEYLAADSARRAASVARADGDPDRDPARLEERLRLARAACSWRPADPAAQRQRFEILEALVRRRLARSDAPVPGAAEGGASADLRALVAEMTQAAVAAVRASPWDASAYPALLVSAELSAPLGAAGAATPPATGLLREVLGTVSWLAPTWVTAHRAMADHFLAAGELEEALVGYRRALELDPALVDPVASHLAERLPDQGWIDRVIPASAEALLRYGDFRSGRGETERAEAAYAASLALEESAVAVLRLHDLYLETGRTDRARETAIRALEGEAIREPGERAALHHALSRSLLSGGRRAEALGALQDAVAADPTSLRFSHELAALVAEERPSEAIARWNEILLRHSSSPELPHFRPDIYLGLARAYEREGRTLEALREYRHVLNDRPGDPVALGRITLLQRGER